MASRVITQLVSDLSGDEIPDGQGETVEFSYRGTQYSIDLTEKEVAGFDKSIAMYVEHATKRGSTRGTTTSRSGAQTIDAKAVRTWAKEQGIDVPDRGRIPARIRDQFVAANKVR